MKLFTLAFFCCCGCGGGGGCRSLCYRRWVCPKWLLCQSNQKRPRTDLQREFGEFGHVTVRTSGVEMVVFWLWGILVAIPELCKNMQKPLFFCNDLFRHPTETTLRKWLFRVSGCKFRCESHPPSFES